MMEIILAGVVSLVITLAAGKLLIPALIRLKAGQSIKEVGPTWHKGKQGTPTMGGLMFIIGIGIAILILGWKGMLEGNFTHLYVYVFALVFGVIGYIDDYQKVKHHQNTGLTAPQKFLLQLAAAVAFLCLMRYEGMLSPNLYIPFFNTHLVLPWVVYMIFAAFVIVGTVNAVNITDGVDGLSASLAVVSIGTFLLAYGEELGDYSTAAIVFIGALLAYLWSNAKPSSLLMGDAGSRAMGFFLAILALKCGHPFAFLLAALVFIVDGSLGILKISFKRFLHISILKNTLTPLHDHVRKRMGWSDEQVVARWLILQAVASALLLLMTR